MSSRVAKGESKRCRPATPAKTLSIRPGRTTSCAKPSTPSRKSKPTHGFKNSYSGFTSSRKARSSEVAEIDPEPVSASADELGGHTSLRTFYERHAEQVDCAGPQPQFSE